MGKYLTKSLFTHALECPTKLYYKAHSDRYISSQDENDFLQALAEGRQFGGFVSRLYFTSDK